MIGTITHILAKAGYKAMNGPLADERRRLAGAVSPAAYVSYDPRLLAGAGWYGYRIALKGGDRSMLEMARYMLEQQYTIRDSYEYYADGVYTFGVLLRQRVPHYGIGGGGAIPEPDALNFYMPDGGTITLTRKGTPTVVELEYSVDGGATWQVWEEVGNVRSLTLAAGQKMYVRNTSETSTGFSITATDFYSFSSVGEYYCKGSVLFLLCKYKSNAVVDQGSFCCLFKNSIDLIEGPDFDFDAIYLNTVRECFYNCPNLTKIGIFSPSSINGDYCATSMFYNCKNLVELPRLLIQVPTANSFRDFAVLCKSVNKVMVNFTDISATNCLYTWLYGVAATGDFYCPAELTIPTGASGIPAGWTRHDI